MGVIVGIVDAGLSQPVLAGFAPPLIARWPGISHILFVYAVSYALCLRLGFSFPPGSVLVFAKMDRPSPVAYWHCAFVAMGYSGGNEGNSPVVHTWCEQLAFACDRRGDVGKFLVTNALAKLS